MQHVANLYFTCGCTSGGADSAQNSQLCNPDSAVPDCCAAVITSVMGEVVWQRRKYLHMQGHSEAMYCGLLLGLRAAVHLGITQLGVYGDSFKFINQLKGEWLVESSLQHLQRTAKELLSHFQRVHLGYMYMFPHHHAVEDAHRLLAQHHATPLPTFLTDTRPPCAAGGSGGSGDRMQRCLICLGDVPREEFVALGECGHQFCTPCLTQHIQTQACQRSASVLCPQPDCSRAFTLAACRTLAPPGSDLYEQLLQAEVEAAIPELQKFYCPHTDCSALHIADCTLPPDQPSECMHCHRLLCAHCHTGWHTGMACDEYQALPADGRQQHDSQLMLLAESNRWQRCSQCKHMIVKSMGCNHIKCRCGHDFCYVCGAAWDRKRRMLVCGH